MRAVVFSSQHRDVTSYHGLSVYYSESPRSFLPVASSGRIHVTFTVTSLPAPFIFHSPQAMVPMGQAPPRWWMTRQRRTDQPTRLNTWGSRHGHIGIRMLGWQAGFLQTAAPSTTTVCICKQFPAMYSPNGMKVPPGTPGPPIKNHRQVVWVCRWRNGVGQSPG